MSTQDNTSNNEEFDIIWLINYLFSKKKQILRTTLVMFVLSMVLFFTKDKVFKVEATIIPHENANGIGGSLGSLAKLAGAGIGTSSEEQIITPELYPSIAKSTPFLYKLAQIPLKWKRADNAEMTYVQYIEGNYKNTLDHIKDYTINLPYTIKFMLFGDGSEPVTMAAPAENTETESAEPQYLLLTKAERIAIDILKSQISVDEDAQTSAFTLTVTAESPEQAATLGAAALHYLQDIIISIHTKNSAKTVDFLQQRYHETEKQYLKVRTEYNKYRDSHRNVISEREDAEGQRLSDEYNIQYSVLTTLSTKLEESRLKLMENTPVFSIIEPIVVPERKFAPSLPKHAIIGIILGLFLSVGFFVVQISFFQVFDTERFKQIKKQFS